MGIPADRARKIGRGVRTLVLLLAAGLAACAPDDRTAREQAGDSPPGAEASASEADRSSRLPDPPAPPPPAPDPWGLSPLSRARIAAELGPGARCRLSDGGKGLMAATVGGAVANDGGRIVRLRRDSSGDLSTGGRFVAGTLAIEVRPGAELVRRDGLVERDSSVTVARGKRGFSVSHGPRWTCDL